MNRSSLILAFGLQLLLSYTLCAMEVPSRPSENVEIARETIKGKAVAITLSIFDNKRQDVPIIVFLHSIGACKEAFIKPGIVEAFDKTHRVIVFDLIGHGESSMIDKLGLDNEDRDAVAAQYYSLPGIIEGIGVALKALHVNSATLVGWSIGGHIAHGVAIKFPELVERIVTSGTPPINYALPEELKIGFSEWFVDTIVQDWLQNPHHYSRQDSEMIIGSMAIPR